MDRVIPVSRVSRLCALTCVVLTACSDSPPEPTYSVVDSAGVRIVTSTGTDSDLPVDVERLFELGGAEEGLEGFYVVSPNSVRVGASGSIYALDMPNSRVVVFDSTGEALHSWGRAGQGPGEVARPVGLDVREPEGVWILDGAKAALVGFDLEGRVLPELPMRLFFLSVDQRFFAKTSDGFMQAGLAPGGIQGQMGAHLMSVRGGDTLRLAEIVFDRPEMVTYPTCGGGLNLPKIFAPDIRWGARGGLAAWAPGAGYALSVQGGEAGPKSVRRDLAVRVATREMAMEELGEGFRINFGRGPCVIPPDEMVDGRGFAEELPWVGGVVVDGSGRLWVERRALGGEPGVIDLFDAEGVYVGTLSNPGDRLLDVGPNDRLLVREEDELGVQRVVVHRVVWRS